MKPLIGLTPSWGDQTFRLYRNYCALIARAGGNPVILPFDFDVNDIDSIAGLIFTGGGDVAAPLGRYEHSPIFLDGVSYKRDDFESRLFTAAHAQNKPMLGICRGHQVMNCMLGGSLFRDVNEAGFTEDHSLGTEATHPIFTQPNSFARVMFGETHEVWSTHHQAVNLTGTGFFVTASSREGVVEVIEHESDRLLGLQTHPERMDFLPPFEWLVKRA